MEIWHHWHPIYKLDFTCQSLPSTSTTVAGVLPLCFPSFFWASLTITLGFPGGSVVKNPPANAEDRGSIPGLGRSSGEGNGNLLQYSCLGTSHGQRSLVSYSPWGRKRVGPNLVTKQQSCWLFWPYFYFLNFCYTQIQF